MPFGIHPRLSNLGIESDSTAGQQADNLGVDPRLEALAAATDQISMLQEQAAMREQPPEGAFERLLSPGGLASLGVGLGAAAFGAPQVGGGILQGLMQGVQEAHQAEKQQWLDHIDRLQGEVDKQRQRLVTLLQAQPGLFLDPQGQNVIDPQLLGPLAGLPIPVSPAAKYAAMARSDGQKTIIDTLSLMFEQAETPEARREVARAMSDMLDLDLPDAAIETFLLPDNQRQLFDTMSEHIDINALSNALLAAQTQGLSLYHPDIVKLWIGRYKEPDVGSISDAMNARILEAYDQFSMWLRSPEGAQFRSEDTYVAIEAWIQATGSTDMAGWLRSKSGFKGGEDLTNEDLLRVVMPTLQTLATLDMFQGGGLMDPEKRKDIVDQSLTDVVGMKKKLQRRASAQTLLTEQARIRATLRETYGDAGDSAFQAVWDDVLSALGATRGSEVNPDELKAMVDAAIERIKAQGQGE
ncbi:MAG: hypothetical protein AMJ65_01645 [Phycisphaerae bacterium SG8_4]|nr:MAG: hypothetical protein AMJ65_01645 [Phycisphaerae bacterium SG8_4]